MGQWTLEFQTFRDHETELVLKDEDGVPLDIDGWFIKFEVVHDDGTITWSTDTDHVEILSPTTNGKAKLTVSKAEIADLPFTWAAFKFFAGADEANPDQIYEGRANVK